MQLSNYDAVRPPYQVGERVRLRPRSEWCPAYAILPEPMICQYYDSINVATLYWALDAFAGWEAEVRETRPLIACLFDVPGGGWFVNAHPDWLAPVATPAAAEDVEPDCKCVSPALHEPGCSWMAWRTKQKRGALPF